jgi:hypothetical protein
MWQSNRYDLTAEDLITAGMLDLGSKKPIVTDRGAAFIQMLKTTPIPVSAWVDPRTLSGESHE